ncbi:MGMT family protein [Anaerolentibacter hominis]|uniref:MGMT family protein n=1 Tax=Anaerolentibacter hominis TaxID=3079009 RepID=UPI0031B8B1A8
MDFYRRVKLVCEHIPRGKVATYGQIALLCGMPRYSRAVGYALKKGLAGEGYAHRVVNHQGFLSGAANFEKPDTQKKLLRSEMVKVSRDNRVDLKKYGWDNSLDEALLLRNMFEEAGI